MDYSKSQITFGPKKKPIKLCTDELEKENAKECIKNERVVLDGHIFKYNGSAIDILFDEKNKPWFKGKDICLMLKYKDPKRIILDNVSDENKKKLKDLKGGKFPPLEKVNIRNTGSTIYLNESGTYELFIKSNKKEAKEFQKWITNDVLPSINKKGYYSEIPIDDIKDGASIIFDGKTQEFVDYGISNVVSDLNDCRIVYLGYIGVVKKISKKCDTDVKVNEQIFKFGTTHRGWQRNIEHQRNFENYITFYVQKSLMNDQIEKLLQQELKQKGLLRFCKVGKYAYTELFTVNTNFTIDDVKMFIETCAKKYSDQMRSELLMLECEKTKQEIERTKQKECELKIEEAKLKTKEIELKIKAVDQIKQKSMKKID